MALPYTTNGIRRQQRESIMSTDQLIDPHALQRSGFSLAFAFIASYSLLIGLASVAHAAPTDPITLEAPPTDQGDAFVPGFRELTDLPATYVDEEYFVSGTADLYNYENNPPEGPTDTEVIQAGVPYRTRLIVRRPEKQNDFNGSVVIEWWNSTAGFDTAPSWDPSAEYFAREGYVYVGVTNSNQGMSFLVGGCSLFDVLPPTCGTRYSTLSLPDDGLAYDILDQIATGLRNGSGLLPPGYDVERIYHTGQSQQGGSVITYASAFHEHAVNDGYFVQGNIGARSINGRPACGAEGSPPFPDCTPSLSGADRLVRSDLSVPLVQAVTETDVAVLFGTGGRQDDTPTYRYYELAGTAHLTIHKGVEVLPEPNLLFLEDLCENELNTIADGPVFGSYAYNAMWDNMDRQVRSGDVPPAGRLMALDATGAVERDAFGNALGGVRLPEMDVPTGRHNPPTNQADPTLPPFLQGIGNLACFLGGSTFPFTTEELHALYRNKGQYVSRVVHAANDLKSDGFLLQEDRMKIVKRAVFFDQLACGLGFELAIVVPVLLRLRRRRVRG
jgi:hypothetical protein